MWIVFLTSIFILFLLWVLLTLFTQSQKHKVFVSEQKPCRLLSGEELEAIYYLDVDKPILDFFRAKLPKSKREKSVYCFSDCSFTLHERHYKGVSSYFFYIDVEGENVEVRVPTYFIEYITVEPTKRYNISCVDRNAAFTLIEIEGMISYPELHDKFRLIDTSVQGMIGKRMAKKEEEKLFLFSAWASVWVNVALFTFPILFLMFFEEPNFFVFMTPMWLPFSLLLYFSYKKRKRYMEKSFILYRIEGTLTYDEEWGNYYINQVELKLPFRWHKHLTEKFSLGDRVEIEGFLHTFDTLDEVKTKKLQPISIRTNSIIIDHKSVPIVRSIWMPLITLMFTITMVFGMHFDKFVPYTYHALNTWSAKNYFYSSDGFRKSNVQENQYVETEGLALPILTKKESSLFAYKIIETNENYIFFPPDVAQSIIDYPKVPKEFSKVIKAYRHIRFNIETLKHCHEYQNNRHYMDYCINSALRNIRENKPVFQSFKTYNVFLKETTPEAFKAFKKELFRHYNLELSSFYAKLQPLLKEGVTYHRYPQNSNYSPHGFYENMEYLNYIFSYLSTFPKREVLAGIVSNVDSKVWYVKEDNYNYIFYTIFLSLFWFLSIFLMLYLIWVLSFRIYGMLKL